MSLLCGISGFACVKIYFSVMHMSRSFLFPWKFPAQNVSIKLQGASMTLNIKRSITKFIWHHLKQRAFICIFAVLSIFYYELLVLSILDVFSLFYSSCRFNLTVTKIQQLHHCGHVPLPHPTTTAPSLAKKWEKKETKQEWSTFMVRGHMIGSRGWDADARVVQQRQTGEGA